MVAITVVVLSFCCGTSINRGSGSGSIYSCNIGRWCLQLKSWQEHHNITTCFRDSYFKQSNIINTSINHLGLLHLGKFNFITSSRHYPLLLLCYILCQSECHEGKNALNVVLVVATTNLLVRLCWFTIPN